MRKLLTFITLVLVSFNLMAQMPGNMPGAMPSNMGHVYGKLTGADGKPVAGASAMIMHKQFDSASKKTKEVFLKAMITKANGEFNFEELPLTGNMTLKVTSTGFAIYQAPISFLPTMDRANAPKTAPSGQPSFPGGAMPSFDKDLGNIQLTNDSKELQNVTITAVTQSIKLNADKKVLNV